MRACIAEYILVKLEEYVSRCCSFGWGDAEKYYKQLKHTAEAGDDIAIIQLCINYLRENQQKKLNSGLIEALYFWLFDIFDGKVPLSKAVDLSADVFFGNRPVKMVENKVSRAMKDLGNSLKRAINESNLTKGHTTEKVIINLETISKNINEKMGRTLKGVEILNKAISGVEKTVENKIDYSMKNMKNSMKRTINEINLTKDNAAEKIITNLDTIGNNINKKMGKTLKEVENLSKMISRLEKTVRKSHLSVGEKIAFGVFIFSVVTLSFILAYGLGKTHMDREYAGTGGAVVPASWWSNKKAWTSASLLFMLLIGSMEFLAYGESSKVKNCGVRGINFFWSALKVGNKLRHGHFKARGRAKIT
jgi:hypothetical protein